MYLPNFYDRLFKRKFILFVSILGYDLFWLGIIALSNASTSSHIGLFMGLMVSIVTMIFALAILIKIYKLMKLIDKKSSQTNTYKNMQTAAMMCLSEGFIGVLINLPSIYKHVFILTVSKRLNDKNYSISTYVSLRLSISLILSLYILEPRI